MTIGDLWNHYTDKSNWREELDYPHIGIDGYVVALGRGDDGWRWSIYRGRAEWCSWLIEPLWSPTVYADENEARAAAWLVFLKISGGPGRLSRKRNLKPRKNEETKMDATVTMGGKCFWVPLDFRQSSL